MSMPIIFDVECECIDCNKPFQNIEHRNSGKIVKKMGKDRGRVRKDVGNRRARTPNWSPHERQYLLELIKDRRDIIIDRSGNGINHCEEREYAWNDILRMLILRYGDKFNGRSIKKLKTQWQNMRRIARDEICLYGASLEKFSKQSLDVCHILKLVKDGQLVVEKVADMSAASSVVEIKTEHMEEDYNQPSTSGLGKSIMKPLTVKSVEELTNASKSSVAPIQRIYITPNSIINADLTTSGSEEVSDPCDPETTDNTEELEQEVPIEQNQAKKNAQVMTEPPIQETPGTMFKPLQRDLQDFFKYTSVQKQLKMDMLKEERQVMRAMRETAELNKIIAEQKLKHVLWIKKKEMAMYSGEPGSGAGKGGGGGGAIREAGGAFGKMEAAREDEFFYKQQQAQLSKLKTHISKEISFHQEQIKRHEDAIRRHKESMANTDK